MATIIQRLDDIITPIVADLGLELFDLDYSGGVVRVTIDTVPETAGADAAIDLSDITAVTRAVSRALDEHDPITDRYSLEVSSPGLERTLRTPRHFERAIGQQVSIKTAPGAGPDRRLSGELVRAGSEGAVPVEAAADPVPSDDDRPPVDPATSIDVRLADGDVRTIAYADIAKARTVFEWGPEPRPERPGPAKQPKQPKSKQTKQKKVETS